MSLNLGSGYNSAIQQFKNSFYDFFIGKGVNHSDITVDNLYDFNTTGNALNANNLFDMSDLDVESKQTLSEIIKLFDMNMRDKRQLLDQSRKLFDTDIVQTVIDVMYDDGFNSFVNEEEDFKIQYKLTEKQKDILGDEFEEVIQEKIDNFVEKFNVKGLIADILPELVRDGEYALGIIPEKTKGITGIIDDLDVVDLLPFYNGNKLQFIIKETIQNNTQNNTKQKQTQMIMPENVVYFRLKYFAKNRIKLDESVITKKHRSRFYKNTGLSIPKFVRVCRPIYFSAIKYINQLKLIEDVNVAQELSNVLRPEVIGVTVPSETTPEKAKEIIRVYEQKLNDISKNIDTNNVDTVGLLNIALKKILLPQWGDGKGTISNIDVANTARTQETRDAIQFIRNLIAISIGIPPFYINITDTPIEKGQLIKIYSRYTRKLASLQKSVADGVRDLVYTHLKYSGNEIERSNIHVDFKSLVNGDVLEDIDLMVASITGLSELFKNLDEIASADNNDLSIDSQQFKKVYDLYTNMFMNISDLLVVDENKVKEEPDENSDFEDQEDIDASNDDAYSDFANSSATQPENL